MTTNLDLDNPAHREALRWACALEEPVDLSMRVTALQAWCVRAISSPVESAAIVRALLERCGVAVVEHGANRGLPDFPYVSVDDGSRYDDGEPAPLYVSFSQAKVSTLIIALLDAEDRDAALAALREAGR